MGVRMVVFFLFVGTTLVNIGGVYMDDNVAHKLYSGRELVNRTSEHVDNLLNNFMIILGLTKNFTERSKIKVLFRIHKNFRQMTDENYKKYKDVIDASQPDIPFINILFNWSQYKQYHNETAQQAFEINNHSFVEINKISNNATGFRNCDKHKLRNDAKENANTSRPSSWREDLKLYVLPTSSRRIYGGNSITISQFSFMASINFKDEFMCGGSIISKYIILTAASCLQTTVSNIDYKPTGLLKARVGSDYTNRDGRLIPVSSVYFHPDYDPSHLANNLALAQLSESLTFYKDNEKLRKIQYDEKASPLPANIATVTLIGWGDKQNNVHNYKEQLAFSTIPIYDLDACNEVYTRQFVTDKNFCGGSIVFGSGACNRDVGGPGLIGNVLVGVISFGAPVCGSPDVPTVFSKIGYYAKWIDTTIRNVDEHFTKTPTRSHKDKNVNVSFSWLLSQHTEESNTYENKSVENDEMMEKRSKHLKEHNLISDNKSTQSPTHLTTKEIGATVIANTQLKNKVITKVSHIVHKILNAILPNDYVQPNESETKSNATESELDSLFEKKKDNVEISDEIADSHEKTTQHEKYVDNTPKLIYSLLKSSNENPNDDENFNISDEIFDTDENTTDGYNHNENKNKHIKSDLKNSLSADLRKTFQNFHNSENERKISLTHMYVDNTPKPFYPELKSSNEKEHIWSYGSNPNSYWDDAQNNDKTLEIDSGINSKNIIDYM